MGTLRGTGSALASWVHGLWSRPLSKPHSRRLTLEPLEDRLAPATFTGAGTALTVDLNAANEVVTLSTNGTAVTAALTGGTATDNGGTGGHVTGFGTATASINSASFTTITITDSAAGTSVAFANSTGSYPQTFNITLNDAASGNVTFAGASTFTAAVTASTTAGFVASDPASSLTLAGSGSNLSLTATGHDILLKGAVSVGGTTNLAANVVEADNAANDFVGALVLNGPVVAAVRDANALVLGASSLNFGTLAQTTTISAGGAITQTGALTVTGTTGTLAVASTGGSITLNHIGNSISANVALALSAGGANNITVVNTAGLQLGDVALGAGTLALTVNGNLNQVAGTTIQTGGAVSLTVDTGLNRNINLGNAGNRIAGAVTVAESNGGDVRDVTLRNAADGALAPTGTPLTTANDVRNLTLFFDNNGVALPGYTISGSLTVVAGGDVTQTASLTVGGTNNTTVTVQGDFGIALTDPGNGLGAVVSLNATQSTQPVAVVNGSALTLGGSDLGRGTFSATAATGAITSTAAVTQRKGAGAATFTVTAGNTVSLTGANDFPGAVIFAGAGLTTVSVRNTDLQAKFANLTIAATVTDLTVTFDNASVVLPSLTLTNLTVTALGIFQAAGAALVLSGTGGFSAGAFALNLSNAGNDFHFLNLSNSGRNDVAVTDVNALAFVASSNLGTCRLTVRAGGTISETAVDSISQAAFGPAGDVQFTSTGGNVSLGGNNALRGTVSVSVAGTSTATVNNPGAPLTLDNVTTGTGAFTAGSRSGGIAQDPNSVLRLGGSSSFTAVGGGSVVLTNRTNTFTGTVGLSAASASVRATGALVLGSSNVSGTLSLQTGGTATDSITQLGPITGGAAASLDSGAASVTLTNAGNDFSSVSVVTTDGAVSVTDTNALNVGTIRMGGGGLALTAGSLGLASATSGIVQTPGGLGDITLDTPAGANISLGSTVNFLRGRVFVSHALNVTLQSQGDLMFGATSTINGNLTATAGGTLFLPANLTSLGALTASFVSTTVTSDITASGAVSFTGALRFTANRTVTAGGSVTIAGDVKVDGPLAFTLSGGQTLQLAQGTWDQEANALTISGTNVGFQIGDGAGRPAVLIMTGGTLSMLGNGAVLIRSDGTFQVGAFAGVDTVILANGSGALTIDGALAVGFGAVNDELIKTGAGVITLDPTAQLVGTGLAGATATPVLASQTALLTGRFANSADAASNPTDFIAGSDIVTPAYDFTQVTVKAGGVAAPSGTATGFLPDGDTFTVKSSLGAAAGLATVVDVSGRLDVVVRNTTAAAPSTLTISTTGGGDGLLPVGGLVVHSPGAVTVTAAVANFTGLCTTAGTLTALAARDLGSVAVPFLLSDGGPTSAPTSMTVGVVQNTTVTLAGALGAFKAVSASNGVSLTAQKFGTLTTTGSAAALDPGNFNAVLTSTTAATGTVVTSATVPGTLGGTWDVRGNVGTVKAGKTSGWILGTVASGFFHNGGRLRNATALSLGNVGSTTVNATGAVAALTAMNVTGSIFTAGSFGTVNVTGSTALGLPGNFGGSLTATGNVAGVALASLSIAGDLLSGSALTFKNGDVTALSVARTVNSSTITAVDTGTRGNLKSMAAGSWVNTNVDARSIGALKVTGNLPLGLFGDFTGSTVTVSGNAAGVGLGTFSAQGSVSSSTFDVQNGNLTTFVVGRQLGSTTVELTDAAFSGLGTIQAGDWAPGGSVLARTIGTVAAVGAAAVGPASPVLVGGISQATIAAYQAGGRGPAVGKLTTNGDLSSSTVAAERGIATLTVGRNAASDTIAADDAQAGAVNVGRIAALTAGAWTSSAVAANTFGTVKIVGYTVPEGGFSTFIPGDVSGGTFLAKGATPTTPVGVGTFSVARNFQTNSTLTAPFGITTMTVGGSVSTGSTVVTDNPLTPAAGFLTTFTAGDLSAATVRAGSIGTLATIGSTANGLLGNLAGSTIAVDGVAATPAGLRAIVSLAVAGDFSDSTLDAPGTVGAVSVTGRVVSFASGVNLAAGYAAGSNLGSLSAGAWGQPGSNLSTDLVSQSVGTFKLVGNAARGFAGTAERAFIDVLGAAAGVGLGTFTATGTVTGSLIRVANGDVTSFTALRFASSDLLVGFRPVKGSDLTLPPLTANWSATNHKIGAFTTTAPFSPADVADTASFVDSDVAAAILGNVTLSGVNPVATATAFGVAFRTSAGAAAKGTVKINGAAAALTPPAADGEFHYLGLPG
jgi:hypothetical protein